MNILYRKSLVFLFCIVVTFLASNAFGQIDRRNAVISKELDDWQRAEERHLDFSDSVSFEKAQNKHHKFGKEVRSVKVPHTKNMDEEREFRRDTDKKHQINMDWEISTIKYEEPNVMEDKGVMNGIAGSYIYRPSYGELLYNRYVNTYRFDGKYGWGKVDYEASNGATLDDIDDYMFEFRGIVGSEYDAFPYDLFIYSGFGYRYLNDDTGGMISYVGSTGYYGYEREANYYYLPLGIEVSNKLKNNWKIIFNGEYDIFLYGKQISHLSDGDPFIPTNNDDLENEQHKGYGIRGSVKVIKDFGLVSFSVEPFVRYWNIEQSDIERAYVDGAYSCFVEPENNSLETGVKLGLLF